MEPMLIVSTNARWMNQKSAKTTDYLIGDYVSGKAAGLRKFPYSVNKATNPLTYESLQQLNEVHGQSLRFVINPLTEYVFLLAIGEVWANMLHNVYAALVDARGFSADKLTNPDGKEGNIVFMRLFMDALALQPCNPTCKYGSFFIDAQD